jgi:protein-tyrosine phosphatase
MAEAVFQHLVDHAGLHSQFNIDSAGTGSWHEGETAHKGTLNVLKKHGIDYSGRSRPLVSSDYDNFDVILAMDHDNLATILARRPKDQPSDSGPKISLLLDYAPQLEERIVPDPYYDGRFDYVYDLVHQASLGLLEAIKKEQGWS